MEAGTAVLFATVAWLVLARSTGSPPAALVVLVAFLYFAAISVALTLIDLDNHRLPDQIVLPGYAIALALFALASALGAGWTHFAGAVVGMALLFAFYFLLRLIRPDGMGGGDVKLAGVVGIHLGWLGWSSLAVGAMAAFLLGGAFGVALMAGRRADRRTAIPFGPWMLAGAWLGIVLGPLLGDWYIDQLGI